MLLFRESGKFLWAVISWDGELSSKNCVLGAHSIALSKDGEGEFDWSYFLVSFGRVKQTADQS